MYGPDPKELIKILLLLFLFGIPIISSAGAGEAPTAPVNLLTNPHFDQAEDNYPVGWHIPPEYWPQEVSRQETMALSGEWIIVAKGGSYVVLVQDTDLIPDNTYTVRVKARRFGEGQLGIQQALPNGNSAPVLWNCSLTPDFRYYYATFQAIAEMTGLIFYKIGPASPTDGIEITSIHLFEGALSPLPITGNVENPNMACLWSEK